MGTNQVGLGIRGHEGRKAYRYIWLNYLVGRAYGMMKEGKKWAKGKYPSTSAG